MGNYGEFPHIAPAPASLRAKGVAFAAAYYREDSKTKGTARIALCSSDLVCEAHTVAEGGCGFGRDAALAFGRDDAATAGLAYFTCMQYSSNSGDRKPWLAVLGFNESVAAMVSAPVLRGSGHTDICKGDEFAVLV